MGSRRPTQPVQDPIDPNDRRGPRRGRRAGAVFRGAHGTWAHGVVSEAIRRAQRELVDPVKGTFFAGDLDRFGNAFRYEEIAGPRSNKRVHQNAEGRAAMAKEIAHAILASNRHQAQFNSFVPQTGRVRVITTLPEQELIALNF
jgi:hypothetical protein